MNIIIIVIMKKNVIILLFCSIIFQIQARTIKVSNFEELQNVNNQAIPGDSIILKNGNWNDCKIILTCNGTASKPIVIKAESAGMVQVTGKSYLRLCGNHLIVDGLNFINGSAAEGNVWEFRMKDKVANECRITNCGINGFNTIKRVSENYWVAFFGKNNRLDHCTFYNKKNLGVLIAVVLDDDRSRLNNHSIDSNYFAPRPPLSSNAGEIIRVGVSQHCTFYSNTIIKNNLFEKCNGEVEIISIKSCGNIIRNNVFKECQGGFSLRHGNNNTVEGNIFLGNNQEGTGGVRFINEGNWAVNNLFYKCRGVNFRSPLAIMNGIFHSPAYRYLPVRDAVFANNTFIDCTPFSLCEGSDKERAIPPANVYLFNNVFANKKDSLLYYVFDKIDSIYFFNNIVSSSIKQTLINGFEKRNISDELKESTLPSKDFKSILPDSIKAQVEHRLKYGFGKNVGFNRWNDYEHAVKNPYIGKGCSWFDRNVFESLKEKQTIVKCKNAEEIDAAIANHKQSITIQLTGDEYNFLHPIVTPPIFCLTSVDTKKPINLKTSTSIPAFFIVSAGSLTTFKNINLNGSNSQAKSFLLSDTSENTNHFNLRMLNVRATGFGGETFFSASKHSIADSIIVRNSSFINNTCNLFDLQKENENVGYYNVERMIVSNCTITNNLGQLLNLYRGGKDESTMGPILTFKDNKIENCRSDKELISLFGVQQSYLTGNLFNNCNAGRTLISYKDNVRAVHYLSNNEYNNSGDVKTNEFLVR